MNAGLQVDETVFIFGTFRLCPARRLLSQNGHLVKIGSRALDVLVTLVESAGRVVTKRELIARVWCNVIVEDTNLRVHISTLRRALGDDRIDSRYIVHVARRGYVFVAPLLVAGEATPPRAMLMAPSLEAPMGSWPRSVVLAAEVM